MSRDPVISVLITVYNREAYVEASIRSVLASTFMDFEVIVVDDGSVDQSAEIVRRIASQDQRVRFIQNEANLGDYGNRMKAATLARGVYLKYVDSDDLIYPHTLAVMLDAIDSDQQLALALSHSLSDDDQPFPWVLSPEESYRKHFLGRGCLSCGPTGAIIRRSTFEELGGFRPQWGVLSDADLWYRIAAKYAVALVPPGLVWWRRHEGQEFTSGEARKIYRDFGFRLNRLHLGNSNCPLRKVHRLLAIRRVNHRYAREIASLAIKRYCFTEAWHAYRESGLHISDLARAAFSGVSVFEKSG